MRAVRLVNSLSRTGRCVICEPRGSDEAVGSIVVAPVQWGMRENRGTDAWWQ